LKEKQFKKSASALFTFFQQILIDARDLFEPLLNLGKTAVDAGLKEQQFRRF